MRGGHPSGGWLPDQRLSVEEALRGFTVDAAWSCFDEETRGSLAVGKLADLVVLDPDILALPPEQLPEAQVLMTIVGGEVVYRRDPTR